ncbi:MAG: hypothetical protein QM757_22870 [Paludibaculum sp.]
MRWTLVFLMAGALSLPAANRKNLALIDTEGGQATLLVTPSGQSVLVDAGWPADAGIPTGSLPRRRKPV